MNPRDYVNRPRESSFLLPKVDSTSPSHLWKSVAQGNDRVAALTNEAGVLAGRLAKIRGNGQSSMGMHPWKIYPYVRGSIPSLENLSPWNDEDTWWRTIRVRTGTSTGYSQRNAYGQASASFFGCDCAQRGALEGYRVSSNGWPHTSETLRAIPRPFNGFQDEFYSREAVFVCDDNAYTWVFAQLQFVSGSPFVNFYIQASSDPTSVGWTNFPEEDPYFFLIGMVDTVMFRGQDYEFAGVTTPAPRQALMYQFIYDAINLDIAPKFYGTWTAPADETPVSPAGAILGQRGYPFNALVHKNRTKSATTRTATYQSRKWFNTATPGDVTDDNWILVGESAQ